MCLEKNECSYLEICLFVWRIENMRVEEYEYLFGKIGIVARRNTTICWKILKFILYKNK